MWAIKTCPALINTKLAQPCWQMMNFPSLQPSQMGITYLGSFHMCHFRAIEPLVKGFLPPSVMHFETVSMHMVNCNNICRLPKTIVSKTLADQIQFWQGQTTEITSTAANEFRTTTARQENQLIFMPLGDSQ
jgi:hypothetical protein